MERKQIDQPSSWLAAWKKQALKEGVSLNEWIGICCNANLPVKEQKTLEKRKPRGRPRKRRIGEGGL